MVRIVNSLPRAAIRPPPLPHVSNDKNNVILTEACALAHAQLKDPVAS